MNKSTKVLVFGDSLTTGAIPSADISRVRTYRTARRWPALLSALLGTSCQILVNARGGRNTDFPDSRPGRIGSRVLERILRAHSPDLLIFFLGINDLANFPKNRAEDSARGLETLVQKAKKLKPTLRVLIIAPPHLLPGGPWKFTAKQVAESKRLAACYRAAAMRNECMFLDAAKVVRASSVDKIHLDKAELPKLAKAVSVRVSSPG